MVICAFLNRRLSENRPDGGSLADDIETSFRINTQSVGLTQANMALKFHTTKNYDGIKLENLNKIAVIKMF